MRVMRVIARSTDRARVASGTSVCSGSAGDGARQAAGGAVASKPAATTECGAAAARAVGTAPERDADPPMRGASGHVAVPSVPARRGACAGTADPHPATTCSDGALASTSACPTEGCSGSRARPGAVAPATSSATATSTPASAERKPSTRPRTLRATSRGRSGGTRVEERWRGASGVIGRVRGGAEIYTAGTGWVARIHHPCARVPMRSLPQTARDEPAPRSERRRRPPESFSAPLAVRSPRVAATTLEPTRGRRSPWRAPAWRAGARARSSSPACRRCCPRSGCPRPSSARRDG